MNKKKHRPKLSAQDNLLLWVKAGGRCEMCNKLLYRDCFNKAIEYNFGEKAHNVADSPAGPRGDIERSEKLSTDIKNILLLCPTCHHGMIDKSPEFYTEEKLRDIKRCHETRIEYLTGFKQNQFSHIITCVYNINQQYTPVDSDMAFHAVIHDGYFHHNDPTIELGLPNSISTDDQQIFWNSAIHNLEGHFEKRLKPRLSKDGDIKHASLFAIAPIPILIKLGVLLTDKSNIQTFQLHRNPKTWEWLADDTDLGFELIAPQNKSTNIALMLSISDTLSENEIRHALSSDSAIWHLRIKHPNNDCIRSKKHLLDFENAFRQALREIKQMHGVDTTINVFPAIPISPAISIGMIWAPKADLPMTIFDKNTNKDKLWTPTITIGKVK